MLWKSSTVAAGGGLPVSNTCGRGTGRGRRTTNRGRGSGHTGPAILPQATLSSTSDSEDLETDSDYLLRLVWKAVQQILAESGHVNVKTSDNPSSSGTIIAYFKAHAQHYTFIQLMLVARCVTMVNVGCSQPSHVHKPYVRITFSHNLSWSPQSPPRSLL